MAGNNGETLLDAEDKGQTQSQELPGKTRGSTWQADNTNFHVSETITLNENPMCLY